MISKTEIKESLRKSGYLLENRVFNFFIQNEFHSESNFYYKDKNNNGGTIYREIDVVASKFLSHFRINEEESITLMIYFNIECINNLSPLVLFANKQRLNSNWCYSFLPLRKELVEDFGLNWNFTVEKFEYRSAIPAKQYCSFVRKKGNSSEWMAHHPDDFHKTLLKLTNFTKKQQKNLKERLEGVRPKTLRLHISIPLIVIQNDLYEIITDKQSDMDVKDKKCYRLISPTEDNLNIDIVTEDFLGNYLETKTNEILLMFENSTEDINGCRN